MLGWTVGGSNGEELVCHKATYQTYSLNSNRPLMLQSPHSVTRGRQLSGGDAVSEGRYREDVWSLGAQA